MKKCWSKFILFLLLSSCGCTKYGPCPPSDHCTDAMIAERLESAPCRCCGTTLQCYTAFSLQNNPKIAALYAKIGIAYADLWEASLLPNPVVEAFARFPDRKHLSTNSEFNLAFQIVDAL